MAALEVIDAPEQRADGPPEPATTRSRWFLGRRSVDVPLALYVAAIVTSPWYVGKSGLPQPGDLLMVCAIVAQVIAQRGRLRYPRYGRTYVLATIGFIGWVIIVGGSWAIILHDIAPMRNAIPFYAFNTMVSLVTISLPVRYGPGVVGLIIHAYIVSMTACLVGGLAIAEAGLYRQVLTFNNPNQAGYFALLAASMAMLQPPTGRRRAWWVDALSLLIAAVITVLSASRAAMLALLPLLFAGASRARHWWAFLLAGATIGPLLLFTIGTSNSIAVARLSDLETNSARGYDRIYHHVEYVFLGAGEGAIGRFDRVVYHAEMHSTLGTVLFSYGLPGLALILLIMWQPVRLQGPVAILSLAPAMVYGLTHQGLRTTELWILTAMLVATAGESRRQIAVPHAVRALMPSTAPRSAREHHE